MADRGTTWHDNEVKALLRIWSGELIQSQLFYIQLFLLFNYGSTSCIIHHCIIYHIIYYVFLIK